MTDDAFLSALEDHSLPPEQFNHAAHIRAGYLVLRGARSFGAALDRIETLIRTYAASLGKDDLYHETITVGFMALINARMKAGGAEGYDAFAAANPDLFDAGVLAAHYPEAFFARTDAKAAFLLPPVSLG